MTLTWALATLGGALLLAVVLHGWWRTRQAQPKRAEAEIKPVGDRVEPALGAGGDVVDAGGAATRLPEPRMVRRVAKIDALIDAISTLVLEAPISGEFVLSQMPPTRRAGTKILLIEGLDTVTGEWASPQPGAHYSELQAGVQLVNRSGALNEIEYSEFVQTLQAFADNVGATPDIPDMLEVVARARELDEQVGPLDAQLTVTLRSNSVAWSVGYVQQIASRHGFVPGVLPGRLVLPSADDGAPPVLVLSFDAQAALADDPHRSPVRECTLTLDVPQTDERMEPFPTWHNAARSLADDMGAEVVDDQGAVVTLHAFAAIGQELGKIYQRLQARDLAAGSVAARRLFS